MKQFVYADHAATTKLDRNAYEEMLPWLLNEYGNASQPYSFSREPKKALWKAREVIATCIGAQPEEIYFTSGGTESDNWAIKGTAFIESKKRAFITSAFEHHAVLNSIQVIEKSLYPVAYMQPTNKGFVTPTILTELINDETRMVSVMLVNNEIGTIQPIKELCEIAHQHGAIFHTDAVQAIGHIPVDVNDLGIDLLSASAHKFNGPKGIGFLYIRKGTKIVPYMDGGSQESKLRAGTENIASIVGMTVALKNNCREMHTNMEYTRSLERRLLAKLDIYGIRYVRNGSAPFLPGLLSLAFNGAEGESILHRMDLLGIAISTGSACNSTDTEVSHVLKAIQLDDELARGTIRISLGKDNTESDVDAIAIALRKILNN